MEKQSFMWLKSKQILKTECITPSIHLFISSWEDQAFAKDTEGPLGGFVWPPRSYSCAFCTRKFKSAQALGGHMNVHRRDRARLKQGFDLGSSPSSASRVSPDNSFIPKKQQEIPSTSDNSSKCPIKLLNPTWGELKKVIVLNDRESTETLTELKEGSKEGIVFNDRESTETLTELKEGSKEGIVFNDRESIETLTGISGDTKLAVGLSLVPERYSSLCYRYDDEEVASTKRQRQSNDTTTLSFFNKSCGSNSKRLCFRSEVVRIKNSSSVLEGSIDLELRLGVLPAVK